jgi:hypothetical protein
VYVVLIGDEDNQKWTGSKTGTFFCSKTWDSIQVNDNVVDWLTLVWFPFSIPKQAFITFFFFFFSFFNIITW